MLSDKDQPDTTLHVNYRSIAMRYLGLYISLVPDFYSREPESAI
jgi:hypothetical protein